MCWEETRRGGGVFTNTLIPLSSSPSEIKLLHTGDHPPLQASGDWAVPPVAQQEPPLPPGKRYYRGEDNNTPMSLGTCATCLRAAVYLSQGRVQRGIVHQRVPVI